MRLIPYEVWYGGFAKSIFDVFTWHDEEDREQVAKHLFLDYEGRAYHNAYHPWWMYTYAWQNQIKLTHAQKIAILYHDVIYDIKSPKGTNELDSAKRLRRDLKKMSSSETIETAAKIVEDTRLHFESDPTFASEESALVLDLDIINMSLPYEQFMEWNDAVEEEYAKVYNPMARLEFLRFFVAKKNIINTDILKHKEERIRYNLNRLIDQKENEILDMTDEEYEHYNNNCN